MWPWAPVYALATAPQYISQRIGASFSSTPVVPSPLASPVLTSTVPISEDGCPVSDFLSTLWFCSSATATATATTTSTSTPVFFPGEIPEPVTIEMTPVLPVTDILCIAGLVVFLVTLLICFKYNLRQVKNTQRPVDTLEEAFLNYSESIVAGTTYYWFPVDEDTLSNIAILQWQDNDHLQSQIATNKRDSDAGESDLRDEINDIIGKCDEKVVAL